MCRNARFKALACRKNVGGFLSNGRQRADAFKNARVRKKYAFKQSSQGEKPPKIRKQSSQEQSSWELLDLLPLKRQRKWAKSREHWSEKFLGTCVPRNLFFFFGRFFCPLYGIQWNAGTACGSECVLKTLACRGLRVGVSGFACRPF